MKTCGDCEYFEGAEDACLSCLSPRFQTTGADEACAAFHLDTTKARQCLACGASADSSLCEH